jgi:hypothetical protein
MLSSLDPAPGARIDTEQRGETRNDEKIFETQARRSGRG